MLVGSGKVGQCCCMRSTSTQRLRSGVKAHPSAMPPRGLQPLTRAPKGGPWSRRTRRASCLHHSRPPRVTTTRGGDAPWPRACSTACLPIRGRCVDFLSPQPTWLVAGHSPCVREASSVAQVVACERRRSGVPNALEVFSRTSAGSRALQGFGLPPGSRPETRRFASSASKRLEARGRASMFVADHDFREANLQPAARLTRGPPKPRPCGLGFRPGCSSAL